MREDGSVRMVSLVMGVGGELGKSSAEGAPVNLEILCVGLQYREPAYREKFAMTKRPWFYRQAPM
jgi:hypothetical protein